MSFNLKSIFRAVLQVGGTALATGIIHGPATGTINSVLGIGAIAYGVIWGQVNAANQVATTTVANAALNGQVQPGPISTVYPPGS